jgi:TatD family-associated radical SAM protein
MSKAAIVYRYSPHPHTIYVNVTNRCSNHCSFCVRNYASGLSGYQLWLENEPTPNEVWNKIQLEVKRGDQEIVWCGFGEPTMRLDLILEITQKIKTKYPRLKVRLDTDGLAQLRNQKRNVVQALKNSGIDSISISLNAENEEKYNSICRPSLPKAYQALLTFAKDCRQYFSQVRLTVVNNKEIDIIQCKKIADKLGCDFKVR